MALLNNSNLSLNEIRLKAQDVFLRNPSNEKAKKLFIQAFVTELIKEEENKFDLFGFQPTSQISGKEKLQKDLSTSTVTQKSVVDPPFGMKAALCFGELEEFQLEVLDLIENEGLSDETKKILNFEKNVMPYEREKGQIDTGQPGSDEKIGQMRLKYSGALKDLSLATSKQFSGQKKIPVTYTLSTEEKDGIKKEISRTWIPFNRAKMANAISSSNLKGTITPQGAGELEFLARMYYAAEKNMNTTLEIPSNIQMDSGISRGLAEEQETFLLNLGDGRLKGKIADRCKSILEVYMILVVEKVLQPLLKFENVQEYAYEGVQKALRKLIGIDEVSDEISEGKYDFNYANIGAWTYTVVRNYAIDQLKGFTDLLFDNSKAADLASGLSFPFSFISKVPTDKAIGNFTKSEEKQDKRTGKAYFVYTYDDKQSFLEDLQKANGFEYDVRSPKEKGEETRGRKAIYQPNNPLFYKNVSDTFRGNFMTSVKKYLPSEEEAVEMPTNIEKKEAELLAASIVDKIKGNLSNVAKDIIEKIINEPDSEKYGQNKIKSFISFNKDLATSILLRMFGYGIYKFVEKESIKEKRQRDKEIKAGLKPSSPKGTYDWMTKPELYLDDFILSLQDNNYLGQGLPSEVTNKLGKKNIPIREFIQLLKKVTLGSGAEGRELEKYFKAGEEESEEFKKLLSSKGFLLQNPSYLRNVYSLLKQLPSGTELGNSPQARLDESMNKIQKLINELKNEFDNYNNKLLKSFNI
jgi:hypothetical protein